MEEMGKELESVQVPEEKREKVNRIVKAVSDFDYDDVPALINS